MLLILCGDLLFSCTIFITMMAWYIALFLAQLAFLSRGQVADKQYCGNLVPNKCCPGRNDSCFVKTETGICFCDMACNEAGKCCPDFQDLCQNSERMNNETACSYEGKTYKLGYHIYKDCRKFICRRINSTSYGFSDCFGVSCLITKELIDAINDGEYTWKASNYSFLWGLHVEEGFRKKLGTLDPSEAMVTMPPISWTQETESLPESFDSREKWPALVRPVLDQGNCGASWAFSIVGVISDRYGIRNKSVSLSPQHLISCNTKEQKGCDGGEVDVAWNYIRSQGLSKESCYPYESGETGITYECKIKYTNTTNRRGKKTEVKCPDGRVSPLHYVTPVWKIEANESAIMDEIFRSGPVLAIFKVQLDFFHYKSGVYQTTDVLKRFPKDIRISAWHSLRIIGWGVDRTYENKSIKYWLCANSWGDKWGEDGYVRILRGADQLNIEDLVLAFTPGHL